MLAVVDPGVGTARRPIAVQAEGRCFVGPDNGLLSWMLGTEAPTPQPRLSCTAAEGEVDVLSGVQAVVVLDRPSFSRPDRQRSFHGRDLFGPVAAHLAGGVPLGRGRARPLDDDPVMLPVPDCPARTGDAVHGEVVHVDRYGNLITSLTGVRFAR